MHHTVVAYNEPFTIWQTKLYTMCYWPTLRTNISVQWRQHGL